MSAKETLEKKFKKLTKGSIMKCCICDNENTGEFILIYGKKYHLSCIECLIDRCDNLEKRIAYLERSINRKEETITELELERVPYTNEYVEEVKMENEELKKQLEYLRSGEYYNQLRFENEMLQQVVDTNGVPSEVYDFLESVHKNTEFLEQQQKFIKYLKSINSFETIGDILNKYKEIIGDKINDKK